MTSALASQVDARLMEKAREDSTEVLTGPQLLATVATILVVAAFFSRVAAAAAAVALAAYVLAPRQPLLIVAQRRESFKVDPLAAAWAECWPSPERAPTLPLAPLPEGSIEDVEHEWMREHAVAPRWSTLERRFLARVKREFAAELRDAPKFIEAYGDRRFLRCYRQDPRRDEDKALERVRAYLAWRKATQADLLRAKVCGPDGEPISPELWPHGEILMACIRLLQTSTDLFDLNGNSVTVYQAFHWPAAALRKQLCSLSTAQLVEFAQFGAEYNAIQLERISLQREREMLDRAHARLKEGRGLPGPLRRDGWGEVTRLCAITDMAGCTFGSLMMPTLLPAFVQAVSLFVNYYPCIVGDLHVVNCAPVIARILRKTLGSVVPKHIADQVKLHINSTGLRDPIEYISTSNLPVQLGGDRPCHLLTPPDPPASHPR